jgi:hypothetical protein
MNSFFVQALGVIGLLLDYASPSTQRVTTPHTDTLRSFSVGFLKN